MPFYTQWALKGKCTGAHESSSSDLGPSDWFCACYPEAAEAASGKGEAADARDGQAGASASGRPLAPPPVKGVGRCFYTRLPRNAKARKLVLSLPLNRPA